MRFAWTGNIEINKSELSGSRSIINFFKPI
jgi:hypothetical protein